MCLQAVKTSSLFLLLIGFLVSSSVGEYESNDYFMKEKPAIRNSQVFTPRLGKRFFANEDNAEKERSYMELLDHVEDTNSPHLPGYGYTLRENKLVAKPLPLNIPSQYLHSWVAIPKGNTD